MSFFSLIYNTVVIPLLSTIMVYIKPFNKKLKEREGLWEEVLEEFYIEDKSMKRIWIHVASMGEFEQVKPVIEKIKKKKKNIKLIVSFFSPSGYNNQKNYNFADAVLYLPFDIRSNAKYFLDTIKPDFAIFVRYEIWRNYLELLRQRNTPSYLICATKPNSALLYKVPILKQFTKSNYNLFDKIYTIDKEHSKFFKQLGVRSQIITSHDTRFDRIIEKVEDSKKLPLFTKQVFDNIFTVVIGSSWKPDEKIVINAIKRLSDNKNFNIKMILVPHEPTKKHIKELQASVTKSILLSQIEAELNLGADINEMLKDSHIIVDSIGKLLQLYSLADCAYIGGGFGAGVHSVIEAAGYGIPISCGPKIINSFDAIKLNQLQGLFVIKNQNDFYNWLKQLITDKQYYNNASKINYEYVAKQSGESEKISEDILKSIY